MTKKDYELIGAAVNGLYLNHPDWYRSLEQVANAIANALVSTDPKFNKEKFFIACGIID